MPRNIVYSEKYVFGKKIHFWENARNPVKSRVCGFPDLIFGKTENPIFGKNQPFLGKSPKMKCVFGNCFREKSRMEDADMRKKGFKGRCEIRMLSKCSLILLHGDVTIYGYTDLVGNS